MFRSFAKSAAAMCLRSIRRSARWLAFRPLLAPIGSLRSRRPRSSPSEDSGCRRALAACKPQGGGRVAVVLHNPAVNAARHHAAAHVEEPEPLPFVEHSAEVLGSDD